MIKGLVGTSPPMGLLAPDSRDLELDLKEAGGFRETLKKESDPKRPPEEDSPQAERSDPTPEKPPGTKKSVDLKVKSQRERAIRKFMDSVEGEFGIPPQKMVEALAQLPEKEMELAPQQTVNQVIAKLGLEPAQAGQVRQLYKGLLNQLQQIEVRAQLPTATDQLLSQLSAERLQFNQTNKAVQGQKIQNLNDQFWMQPEPEIEPMPAQDLKDMEQALDLLKVQIGMPEKPGAQKVIGPELEKMSPEVQLKTVEDLLQLVKEKVPTEEIATIRSEVAVMPFMPQAQTKAPKLSEKLTDEILVNPEQEISQPSSDNLELSLMKRMLGLEEAGDSREWKPAEGQKSPEKKVTLTETVEVMPTLEPSQSVSLRGQELPTMAAPAPLAPLPQPTHTQRVENVQNLMNQAQVLVQKGGGEMKVEMTPEGMGSVQMKLKVLDGKVQLQMSTENKEVKKMIESSIADLKQSLATHNLAVDQVRVDVVHKTMGSSDVRQDLQGQMNDFLNQQQQRDGTRQFWQQFNENFGNRQAREGYYDAQNIRRGPTEQKLPGFSSSSTPTTLGSGRGKSLNLVA